jgi:AcrR family transcriptional regulator
MTRQRERLSADARREQLMAAAVDVLAARGFPATTADEIAAQANVSKGLLWHYFADLDQLFEKTAHRTMATLANAAAGTIDLDRPAPEVIRSAVHAAADLHRTHGAERRAMREIVQNLRTIDGDLLLGHRDLRDLYAAQASIFRRGQAEGDFRDSFDPALAAVTYQGAVDAMLGFFDAYPDSDRHAHAETVADILLGGVTQVARQSPPR